MNAERFESFVMVRTHLTNAKRALHSAAAACPTACGRLQRDIRSLERLVDSLYVAANNCVQSNRPVVFAQDNDQIPTQHQSVPVDEQAAAPSDQRAGSVANELLGGSERP
jgi:hypothetical protein